MKSNNAHKMNQIIDMLDSITERINSIEKLLLNNNSKNEKELIEGLYEAMQEAITDAVSE